MRFLTLIVVAAICTVLTTCCQAVELHVAVDGNDAFDGSPARPFATLQCARNAVRELGGAASLGESVTVYIHGGTYTLTEPLMLQAEDSGQPDRPVTYCACVGERVRLVGGPLVPRFSILHDGIWKADAQGLALGDACRVLVCRGHRQPLARYPNWDPHDANGGAWTYVAGERIDKYADAPGFEAFYKAHPDLDYWQRNVPALKRTLHMLPGDLRQWRHPADGEVSIFPRFNWWHYLLPIESLDRKGRVLNLGAGSFYEIRPGDRYFVRNLLEELDAPGEWFYDRREQVLYFWPPDSGEPSEVYVAASKNMLVLNDCAHLVVRGLTLGCCNGSAVILNGCHDCQIIGNTIQNTGDYEGSGVEVDGGHRNSIIGNDIHHCGSHGICLGGGDVERLVLGENRAENNYIHHVGRVGRYGRGIELTGAGNLVRHNLIHDIPQAGINMWGCHHVIEYNHLHHTCLEGEDTGAISGGAIDWLSWQGAIIRYNFIHDTMGYGYDEQQGKWRSPYFTWALYPDWAASGVQIVGNILVRAPRGLLHLHSGRDNVIENNILVDGGESQLFCQGWTTNTGYWTTNVKRWTERYEAARKHAAWRDVATLRDPRAVPLPDGHVMRGNTVRRNIFFYHGPHAALLRYNDIPLKENSSDENLVFHFGLPIRTGYFQARPDSGGPNLLRDPGLEQASIGLFPAPWRAVTKADDATEVTVTAAVVHNGKHAAEVNTGGPLKDSATQQTVSLHLDYIPFQPGTAYRFTVWVKGDAPSGQVALQAFSWQKQTHNWSVSRAHGTSNDWQSLSLLFRTPDVGEARYRPTMQRLWCRLSFPAHTGRYWIDDLSWRMVAVTDQWQGWQARGMDRHSLVADPLFVAPDRDDYQLQAGSPALQLGFQPIPIEKIGPYASPLRASWPIVEKVEASASLQPSR